MKEERSAHGVEVTVRGIASGGAGVADLPDGRVVFVPRTAPGDRARIDISRSRSRWAVGSLVRVIEPGPDRREALCSLYARCGGCQLQHLPYDAQLAWKGRFVADALSRIGKLGEVEPPAVVPSPEATGYRNRITYTLRRLRGGRVVAGFHALARPAHVVDVASECVLPESALGAAWERVRGGWGPGARHLPQGGRLRLTLRSAPGGIELLVEGGARGWSANALATAVGGLAAVHHRPEGAEEATLVHGAAAVLGSAFLQANRLAADLLRTHVLDLVGTADASSGRVRAVDAYCGIGETGRMLANRGWQVVGIELDATAVALATEAAPEGFSVIRGRVEERLRAALPADLLVVNPPRTGLHPAVPDAVLDAPPPAIVYVSCDPATLARDLGRLAVAYTLDGLRSFDLFPQTAHVETVALLRSREAVA